jgi:hypothetical protein
MASLDNPHNVKSVQHLSLKSARQQIMIWDVELLSSSDTLTVPGLESTSAVGSLTSGISVSAGALTEGDNTLTITGGSAGTRAIIATAHRKGLVNSTSRDEDPT